MNVKRKRKVLNVAFKQFQRLPDFSRLKLNTERPHLVSTSPAKPQAGSNDPAVGAQSLTE